MAEIRRIPQVEGRAALRELVGVLKFAVPSAVVWVGVNRLWPDEWTEPDEQTRQQIALAVSGLLVVFALWALVECLVHAHRWRQARRWERMLDDPATAHLVPPLASHLKTVASSSGFTVVGRWALLAAFPVGLTVYSALALAGRVPPLHDDTGADVSAGYLILGVAFLPLTILAVRRARRWRVARAVERLSSDSRLAPPPHIAADVAPRSASSIPHLDVIFGREGAGLDPQTISLRCGRPMSEPLHILYLRLFDNVAGTARFLNGRWRYAGYVYLLRSATQVDVDEFESAKDSDSMAMLFISTPDQLEAAIARQSTGIYDEPRPDGLIKRWRWATNRERGRYPAPALLCHSSFWKSAVDLLLTRVDLVALDLSGYRPEHTGTRYELQRVIDRFPIDHVMLLAETTSDRRFLTAQVGAAWAQMAEGSPNSGSDPRAVHVELGSEALETRARSARMVAVGMNDWNATIIEEFRANDGRVGGNFEGTPMLLLHTRGARSGRERVNPLLYRRDGDAFVVCAPEFGAPTNPAWYHNLVAHPEVEAEVGADTVLLRARVATGAERERLWNAQEQDTPGFADYERNTPRQIPVVILEPR
jgi:deazaflavin-dependent oxidoreductase (nitroreductase family)